MVATSVALIGIACSKDTPTTETTLVGNWVKRTVYGGDDVAGAASFVINNVAYVGTGYDGNKRYSDLYSFDGVSWSQKADMPAAAIKRNSAAAFAIGTKGYIVGGSCDANLAPNGRLQDVWEYDADMGMWTATAKNSLPDLNATAGSGGRYGAVGFAIKGKGYISCGYTGKSQNDMWEFDPTGMAGMGSWTKKTSMPSTDKRTSAAVFVYKDSAYIVSGISNGTTVNEMFMYSATNDKWTQKRNIANTSSETYDDTYSSIMRSDAVGFIMGTKGYLTTGINNSYNNTTWEYDFATDLWSQKTAFERTERSNAVAFTINGRGFVGLGKNTTFYTGNFEEFFPTATLNAND